MKTRQLYLYKDLLVELGVNLFLTKSGYYSVGNGFEKSFHTYQN